MSKTMEIPKPGKSAMGKQVLSSKETCPRVSFGKGTRDQLNAHGYMSEEHARRVNAAQRHNPAAKYEVESGTGKQKNARHRTMPAFTMGRSKRFADVPNYTPLSTPGPGAYE